MILFYRVILIFIALFLGVMSAQAGIFCSSDLNGNGKIEQNERWSCLNTTPALCPQGLVNCSVSTYQLTGAVFTSPTSISCRNGLNGVTANPVLNKISFTGYSNVGGGVFTTDAGALILSGGGSISGSLSAAVITKIVGNGSNLDFYGTSGDSCDPAASVLIGSITVSGASFSGSVGPYSAIMEISLSGGNTLSFKALSCSADTGCTFVDAGSITFSGASYACPSGSQYTCANNGGIYQCSNITCLDDSVIGTSSRVCAMDINGDGKVDFSSELIGCKTVGGKDFCPLGALNCTNNSITPWCPKDGIVCPAGGAYNLTTMRCEVSYTPPSCPSGYLKIGTDDLCYAEPSGGSYNGVFNQTNNHCEISFSIVCPDGFSYDNNINLCVQAVACPNGGTLDSTTDKCSISLASVCPSTYTFNSTSGKCLQAPSCSGGGAYNANHNSCEIVFIPGCSDGYTYNSSYGTCQAAPICPAGSIYNTTLHKCFVSALTLCPSEYTYNASTDRCELSPPCPADSAYSNSADKCTLAVTLVCPSGTVWNASAGKCEASPTYSCASGYTWDATLWKCKIAPTCASGGSLNGAIDLCLQNIAPSCPSGYTFNGSICQAQATNTCASGFTYNSSKDQCEKAAANGPSIPAVTITWPSNGSWTTVSGSGEYLNMSGYGQIRVPGAAFSGSSSYSVTYWGRGAGASVYACDANRLSRFSDCNQGWVSVSGWTVSGGFRWGEVCPWGTCKVWSDGSNTIYNNSGSPGLVFSGLGCPSGGVLIGSLCVLAATKSCSGGGSYNSTSKYCEVAANNPCGVGYVWNSSRGNCEAAPLCSGGAVYNAASDSCLADRIITCPAGTSYNGGTGTCQSDSSISCSLSGFTYNSGLGLCIQDVSCPSLGILNSSSSKCEITLGTGSCAAGFVFDDSNDACTKSPDCPAGSTLSAAHDSCEQDILRLCSSGYAYNSTYGICQSTPLCSDGGLLDANQKTCYIAAAGLCPGIYAYSVQNGVCEAVPPCPSGSLYSSNSDKCATAIAIQCPPSYTYDPSTHLCYADPLCPVGFFNQDAHVCGGVYACPYGSQYTCLQDPDSASLKCSNNSCFDLGAAKTDSIIADMRSYSNDGVVTDKGCQGTVMIFNGKPGQCRSAGIKTNLMSCCNDEVESVLWMKEKCGDMDSRTVSLRKKGNCHFIGDYCQDNWPLIGCVQMADMYCCFSGKLARILHEQGRPQLKSFSDGWGSVTSPDCRGFTAEEFSMLDFSRMNLGEYFQDISDKTQARVPQVIDKSTKQVQDFFNNTINNKQ